MLRTLILDNVVLAMTIAFFVPAIIVLFYTFRKKTDKVIALCEAFVAGFVSVMMLPVFIK